MVPDPAPIPMQITYIQRLRYPDPSAAALQSIRMAAAFARQANTTFFIPDLLMPEADIRQQYGIEDSPLRIWPLQTKRWPAFIRERGPLRQFVYNALIALLLSIHQIWQCSNSRHQVVFVRSEREIRFWGVAWRYWPWKQQWTLVCELHDLFISRPDPSAPSAQKLRRILMNYDVVVALTHELARDIQILTQNRVKPSVVPTCTGLSRHPTAPTVTLNPDQIVLGYIGTVDQLHGVEDLFLALGYLPKHFRLKVIGRVHPSATTTIQKFMEDPNVANRIEFITQIAYREIPAYMDECDILLAPAGDNPHSRRYRSPLKLFDYMTRGKPIIAADVPAHRELLQDGLDARLYQPNDPQALADCIQTLVAHPQQAQAIAWAAWEKSVNYTYEARAHNFIVLIRRAIEKTCRDEPSDFTQ